MRKLYSLDTINCEFPNPCDAARDGLIAFGGDLSPRRLISAYSQGIFPWYSPGEPILWWSPDPRLILFPHKLNVSKSLRKRIRKKNFHVTMDCAFESVIQECANIRVENGTGTWITEEMIQAYMELYDLGFAHSVETWFDNELAGGLYGVSLGHAFFGESMFFRKTDASKIAMVALTAFVKTFDFDFIDCQLSTSHLVSMGAEDISRGAFLELLGQSLQHESLRGRWVFDDQITKGFP